MEANLGATTLPFKSAKNNLVGIFNTSTQPGSLSRLVNWSCTAAPTPPTAGTPCANALVRWWMLGYAYLLTSRSATAYG